MSCYQVIMSCYQVIMSCYHVIMSCYRVIINFLLTEREVCTEKYRLYKKKFVQKERGPIFLCTYRESEINKKFIIWHLYSKQTNKKTKNKKRLYINKKCMI